MSNREPRTPRGMLWLTAFLWVACGLPVVIIAMLVIGAITIQQDTSLYGSLINTLGVLTLVWMFLMPVLGGLALRHRGKKIEAPQRDMLMK